MVGQSKTTRNFLTEPALFFFPKEVFSSVHLVKSYIMFIPVIILLRIN